MHADQLFSLLGQLSFSPEWLGKQLRPPIHMSLEEVEIPMILIKLKAIQYL
jgi:hypothetical protein